MKNGLVLVFYFNCFITVDVPCIMFVYVFIVAWFMILGAMDISQKPGVHYSQTKELQQFCSKWIIRNWELGFVSVEIEMPELNSTDHVLVSCVIYGIIPYKSSRWLFLGVGVALVCKVDDFIIESERGGSFNVEQLIQIPVACYVWIYVWVGYFAISRNLFI